MDTKSYLGFAGAWIGLICWLGCADAPSSSEKQPSPENQTQPAVTRRAAKTPHNGPAKATPKSPSGRQTRAARKGAAPDEPGMTGSAAIGRVTQIVDDAVDYAPTLVVWLIDTSASSMEWGSGVHAALRAYYSDGGGKPPEVKRQRLTSAVWTFAGQPVELLARTADGAKVCQALDDLRPADGGRELPFTAIGEVLKRYLPVRRKEQAEVMLILVTDEAGDDWKLVDQVIATPAKYAISVYVVGVPAPLGRLTALDPTIEVSAKQPAGTPAAPQEAAAEATWLPVRQGPESRYSERIHLQFAVDEQWDLIDSGFGPFALQWICDATGGSFLAVRKTDGGSLIAAAQRREWPGYGALRFDSRRLRDYRPDQISEQAYRQLLQDNKACAALHQAAQLGKIEVLRNPDTMFVKGSEAELKRRLDQAQQSAARVAPDVNRLYELLKQGQGDREQVTRRRWAAAFDLAYGRTCAAKARIDGYNAMLAALKRGRRFTQADSTRWVLEPAPTIDAGSSLRNLAERAEMLLRRVVQQHPGTPWAAIAQGELEIPLGWKWTEQP